MVSSPVGNGCWYLGMNCKNPPFNNHEGAGEAVAYAVPYQKIMDAVLYGLATPLYGGDAQCCLTRAEWPQAHRLLRPISSRPKQLLAEAGYGQWF